MRTPTITTIALLIAASTSLRAAEPAAKKPPVGIPTDAILFSGNWYRVYLDVTSWDDAKIKCERVGGHLVVIHDEPTQAFIRKLAEDRPFWLGGFKKTEGKWEWIDGSPFDFKGWARGEPNEGFGYKVLTTWHGGWGDNQPKRSGIIGYICEWKDR